MYCDGSPRPAANGLPLSEYQPVCGEFPEDGAETPGGRQTQPANPGNKLCMYTLLYGSSLTQRVLHLTAVFMSAFSIKCLSNDHKRMG